MKDATAKQIAARRRNWTIRTIRGLHSFVTRTDVDLTRCERDEIADLVAKILQRLDA